MRWRKFMVLMGGGVAARYARTGGGPYLSPRPHDYLAENRRVADHSVFSTSLGSQHLLLSYRCD